MYKGIKVTSERKPEPKPQPKPEAKFRAQYKQYGLTYSRTEMSRDYALEKLQEQLYKKNLDMDEYYIAQETHKPHTPQEKAECKFCSNKPENCPEHHLHIWFSLSKKPNFKSSKCFDIEFEGKTYHPNIGNKKKNWVYNYLKKQDITPLTNISSGYIGLAKEGKLKEAIELFQDMEPRCFATQGHNVLRNLKNLAKKKRPEHIYPLTGDTIDIPEGKSLVVIGKTESGKTEWCKSYVTHYLKKTFLKVTHIDHLKKYDGEDVIIWDDVNFTHIPRTSCIHIAEVRNSRQIHMRHTVADIPPGILNIFTGNEYMFPIDDYGAIDRRLHLAPNIRFY